MQLVWRNLRIGEWRDLLQQTSKANWMQAWPYAKASYERDHKITRVAEIRKDGGPVGFTAFQEIKLGPLHFIELHRGPLWFTEELSLKTFQEFLSELGQLYPPRILRRRRLLLEWDSRIPVPNLQGSFVSRRESYQTIWLDLRPSLEDLRRQFKQKWRNALNKGLRLQLNIELDQGIQHLTPFLKSYELHKANKNYRGPSARFIECEYSAAIKTQDAFLLWAETQGIRVAGLYIAIHGVSASYRISWNTSMGRLTNAHYVLLWEAIQILKSRGIKYFDLGGIKPDEAQGVSHFKQGLGGQEIQLLGMFS